jgi:long-chain-acyl-CoA dehydrogenase
MSEPDAGAVPRFYGDDHTAFREVVREVVPHQREWEQDRAIPRSVWLAAGRQGILGMRFPEEFGGGGMSDFRYRCVAHEEFSRAIAPSANTGMAVIAELCQTRGSTHAVSDTWGGTV